MHGQLVAYMLMWTDSAPDPNAVKVAMLTLVGGIVATAGTVLVAFRSPREPRSERRADRDDDRYHSVLRAQLTDARKDASSARERCEAAQGRIDAFERFLWLHHIDPEKIVRGDEKIDDVRI